MRDDRCVGRIQLPEKSRTDFLDDFNQKYAAINLKIQPKSENGEAESDEDSGDC